MSVHLQSVPKPAIGEDGQAMQEGKIKARDALAASSIFFALLRLPNARTHFFNAFTLRNIMKLLEKQAGLAKGKDKAAGKRKRAGADANGNDKRGKGAKGRRVSKENEEECSEVCAWDLCLICAHAFTCVLASSFEQKFCSILFVTRL
jgi:hypothetical protein